MAPQWLIDLIGDEKIADIISRYTLALLIIFLTIIILRNVVMVLLRRALHFSQQTNTNFDETIIKAFNPSLRIISTLIGIWLALTVLDFEDTFSKLISDVTVALMAVALFWGFYRSTDSVILAMVAVARKNNQRIDPNIVRFSKQLAKALIVIVAFVIVMEQFGYNLNGLLAGLGIGGLAVALAAQEALSNLVGYFVIMGDAPFYVDDFIVTDSGSGTVEGVGFRSTRLRQLDQSLMFIPNGKLTAGSITNWTRLSKRRLDMNLGLTYDTKPDQLLSVVQIVRDMLDNHPRVIEDSVFVQFFSFNESSLDIRIICYINEPAWAEFHAIKEDIYIRIMKLLEERGIEIAFPTRTIIMQETLPPDVAAALANAEAAEAKLPEPPRKIDTNLNLEQPESPAVTDEIADAGEDGR